MIWSIFISALGLLFVFEGILPFLSPIFWRRVMQQVYLQNDKVLRIMGLVSMLVGLALVCMAQDLYSGAF
jgi:uncharacterized protein YjeT (DUF2065 family)